MDIIIKIILPVALPESNVMRVTVTLGDSPNAPAKTTQTSRVDPSDKEYSVLSIPIVTAGEVHTLISL